MVSSLNVRKTKKVVAVLVLAFLMFALPGSLSFAHHPATKNGQAASITSTAANSRAAPAYLGHAFFPREPRLEDVGPLSGFAPIGIASYGPSGGNAIQTGGVRGVATFNDLGIGFFSAEEINNSIVIPYVGAYNASLQENSVLWLGNLGAYWTQNVMILKENNPDSYTLQLIDNVWNFTSASSNMNQQVTNGTGSVQCINANNVTSCFYFTVDPTAMTVTPPFSVSLTMSLVSGSSAAATISFQYQVQDSKGKNYTGEYDSVKLYPFVTGTHPYFQIGGNSPVSSSLFGATTITLPSDLEFTLGGPGGGSSVFVNSVDGSEQLFYLRDASYVSVPDAYSIGSDTAEEASGVSVSPGLSNTSAPNAILRGGDDSVQKLWPLPLSILVSGMNEYESEILDLKGNAFYAANTSSPATPAGNILIAESSTPASRFTDSHGRFEFSFAPNDTGVFVESFSYAGSVAFEPENVTVQIAVSLLNVSTSGGSSVLGKFNSTSALIQNRSSVLIPVLQGDTLSVTFQNVTTSGLEREFFTGFGNSTSPNNVVVTLNGNASQRVDALFVRQYLVTIDNPYVNMVSTSWHNESSSVELSAPNTVAPRSGGTLSFESWLVNGKSLNSSSPDTSVPVDGPLVVTAEYAPQPPSPYTTVIEIGVAAVALIVGLVAGYVVGKRTHVI